jgi:membrane protease YdiL (CAAX protease family)
MGRTTVTKILTYRPVTVYVFFSLFVMFMGLEIISRELINLLAYILPVPDGFFGSAMPDNILLTVISSAIVPAFTEELFFRGVLLIRLRTAYGEKKAILFSALLFGLMHINPWQALNAFVGGLFYAWIYLRFKNIWLSMFMHMYFNILAFYMPFPGIIITSKNSYTTLIIHPPWFDALGLILFLAGLFITVQLTRPTLKPAPPPE